MASGWRRRRRSARSGRHKINSGPALRVDVPCSSHSFTDIQPRKQGEGAAATTSAAYRAPRPRAEWFGALIVEKIWKAIGIIAIVFLCRCRRLFALLAIARSASQLVDRRADERAPAARRYRSASSHPSMKNKSAVDYILRTLGLVHAGSRRAVARDPSPAQGQSFIERFRDYVYAAWEGNGLDSTSPARGPVVQRNLYHSVGDAQACDENKLRLAQGREWHIGPIGPMKRSNVWWRLSEHFEVSAINVMPSIVPQSVVAPLVSRAASE